MCYVLCVVRVSSYVGNNVPFSRLGAYLVRKDDELTSALGRKL